jgi:hypothetical protein
MVNKAVQQIALHHPGQGPIAKDYKTTYFMCLLFDVAITTPEDAQLYAHQHGNNRIKLCTQGQLQTLCHIFLTYVAADKS